MDGIRMADGNKRGVIAEEVFVLKSKRKIPGSGAGPGAFQKLFYL